MQRFRIKKVNIMDLCGGGGVGLKTPEKPTSSFAYYYIYALFYFLFVLLFIFFLLYFFRGEVFFLFLPPVHVGPSLMAGGAKFMCDPFRAFPRANVLRRAPRRTLFKTIPEHETRPFPVQRIIYHPADDVKL